MKKKAIGKSACPIARSLQHVGEWWSILILRDALRGLSRFDEFQKSLSIAPNMLTRRLNGLMESGLLVRRLYSERPPRYEYQLTECGKDFLPVIVSLLAWGSRHFTPEGKCSALLDTKTGKPADPVVVDRKSGKPLTIDNTMFAGDTKARGKTPALRQPAQ